MRHKGINMVNITRRQESNVGTSCLIVGMGFSVRSLTRYSSFNERCITTLAVIETCLVLVGHMSLNVLCVRGAVHCTVTG